MTIQFHLTFAHYISRDNATSDCKFAEQTALVQHVAAYYRFFAEQLWPDKQHQPRFPVLLGINALTLWTGAARMALSGHEAAVYPVLRTALEPAYYALMITRNPDLGTIWSARHHGDEKRKACRKAFTSAASDAVQIVDGFEADRSLRARPYNTNIHFGAHPNALLVMNNVQSGPFAEWNPGLSVGGIYPGELV